MARMGARVSKLEANAPRVNPALDLNLEHLDDDELRVIASAPFSADGQVNWVAMSDETLERLECILVKLEGLASRGTSVPLN